MKITSWWQEKKPWTSKAKTSSSDTQFTERSFPTSIITSTSRTHYPFEFAPEPSPEQVDNIRFIFCPVCGSRGKMEPFTTNRRESGFCGSCGSWSRQRLIAVLLIGIINRLTGACISHLASHHFPQHIKIFSAEHFGAVHETLRGLPGYSWSRYSGSEHQSGEVVNGHPHQDLMATSFPDNHFDIVLTSDVMEHIPEPYLAHGEIYRILKPGGVHIFTVPCSLNNPIDDQRAAVVNGKLLYLAPPEWHGESTDSNLVYTIFGLEMVCHLWTLGFRVLIHESSDPEKGIIGFNAVAFEAAKHHDPLSRDVPMGLRSRPS